MLEERNAQAFLALYREHRFEDQRAFYHKRAAEYQAALREAQAITTGLMVVIVIATNVGQFSIPWLTTVGNLVAVICPILAGALASYISLYAYAAQFKLYAEAVSQLDQLALCGPDDAWFDKVEAVFATEQGQWPLELQKFDVMALARTPTAPDSRS